MILHHLLGGQSEPLSGAHIGELGGLQHLEEDHVLGAGILDVVRSGLGDVSNAACREIESAGSFWGLEDSDTGRALEEVVPFGRSCVPVNLAHSTGLDGDERSGKVLSDGEGCWVENLDRSARDLVRSLLRPVVRLRLERAIHRSGGGGEVLSIINCIGLRCTIEDLCQAWSAMLHFSRMNYGRVILT